MEYAALWLTYKQRSTPYHAATHALLKSREKVDLRLLTIYRRDGHRNRDFKHNRTKHAKRSFSRPVIWGMYANSGHREKKRCCV